MITEVHATGHPVLCFKQSSPEGFTIVEEETSAKDEEITSRERAYICRFCSCVITFPDKAMQVNGSHRHVFKNPAGIVYEIGCFSSAEGCITLGDPIMEFTWFSGFEWNFALCSGCLSHLGWFYRSKGSVFFGLVFDYLAENI